MSASDAERIGKKFAMFLLMTTEPSAAVDSWLKDSIGNREDWESTKKNYDPTEI